MKEFKNYSLETTYGAVNVYIKDNKAANTILFIHGFNSSHAFAKNIYDLECNFNIVTFDFPPFDINLEKLVGIVDEITDRVLKGKNFYYLGHSLGGTVNLSVTNKGRIKDRILVSPLNPSLAKSSGYARLEKTLKPVTAIQKLGSKIIKKGVEIVASYTDTPVLAEFVNDDSVYKAIMEHVILNRDFLEKTLLQKYIDFKAHYIIGSNDGIIPTELFVDFVRNDLKREVLVIEGAKHNPFKDKPEEMLKALNDIVPHKRRFFLFKFFTTKNLTPREVKEVAQ